MKTKFVNILFITALSLSVFSCKDKAKEATTTEAETPAVTEAVNTEIYTVDKASSTIAWTGFKPTGSHNGTIGLESGALNVANGKVVGGSFIIDMASITVLDIPADDKGNAKLVGHLTNADFFDVEKYPSAVFTITEVTDAEGKTMLSGNLTLKEVKNNVTFPVTIANEGGAITIISEAFSIDRTKWNVQYGSKSIFDNLGDKFINDDIELKITVKAAKS
ncbi:YceI family protein [Algibacter lectus]|uniref:Polyisoprenoid-binding protein YceI n=1 Tax=Algibacter lectus TaxID=221126 RepID=A0A090WZI2_9FLAO|nr:YceI family protein [Algibacter lectus]MDO7138507.1 YceI family protein [Algibacter lectus]MWW26766.1 YceI family protein [Algibacter lectus]TDY65505.1 polyisoprenoid-binding protein YceI [Algibacter lectus]SFD66070.1 Polyisoprenoid-binding protein YceI [Algibacter lectus]GAL64554.1 rhodanese-like domain protein [Algibacter lectus]